MKNFVISVGLAAFVAMVLVGCGDNLKSSSKKTGLAPNIDLSSSRANANSTAIRGLSGVSSLEMKKQAGLRSIKVIYFEYDSCLGL